MTKQYTTVGEKIYKKMITCIRSEDPSESAILPSSQEDSEPQQQLKHETLMMEITKHALTDQKAIIPDASAIQLEKLNGRIHTNEVCGEINSDDEAYTNEESDDCDYDDEDCTKELAIRNRKNWSEEESKEAALLREVGLEEAYFRRTQQQYMLRQRNSTSIQHANDGDHRKKAFMTNHRIALERNRRYFRYGQHYAPTTNSSSVITFSSIPTATSTSKTLSYIYTALSATTLQLDTDGSLARQKRTSSSTSSSTSTSTKLSAGMIVDTDVDQPKRRKRETLTTTNSLLLESAPNTISPTTSGTSGASKSIYTPPTSSVLQLGTGDNTTLALKLRGARFTSISTRTTTGTSPSEPSTSTKLAKGIIVDSNKQQAKGRKRGRNSSQ